MATMEYIKTLRGVPQSIQDNGSEFGSRALEQRVYENSVIFDFSRPGKPADNQFIESFNGSFEDEWLNRHRFLSSGDARDKIEHWRQEYNRFRPHSSLDHSTLEEFRHKQSGAGNF
jgi:putative transposase